MTVQEQVQAIRDCTYELVALVRSGGSEDDARFESTAIVAALDSLVAYVERLESERDGLRHSETSGKATASSLTERLENQISEATETVAVVEAEVMHDAILDALDFSTGWSRPMADSERLDHITKLLTAALAATATAPLAPPKESL